MKKKYTKAKVEIIPLKTEAGICATNNNDATATNPQKDPNDSTTNYNDPFEGEFEGGGAKAFDINEANGFSSDSIPPTKE